MSFFATYVSIRYRHVLIRNIIFWFFKNMDTLKKRSPAMSNAASCMRAMPGRLTNKPSKKYHFVDIMNTRDSGLLHVPIRLFEKKRTIL